MHNYYGTTDKGGIEKNEDWISSFETGETLFLIMLDGFGIEDDNDTKILMPEITNKIEDFIKKFYMQGFDITTIMNQGIYLANVIMQENRKKEEYKKCGASITICGIYNNVLYISNAGINRVYLLRENNIFQGTKDNNEAQVLLDNNQITQEEYETHPKRNVVTEGLGKDNINIFNSSVNLQSEDIVVMLTDGIYRALGDEVVKNVVIDSGDIKKACEWLIEGSNEFKSPDNLSAIVSYIK